MNFVDDEGNILVPKAVRPIIDCQITQLGDKKGSVRQYRFGNLHVREYENHYSVHVDQIDPRIDPLGHLIIDTPNYGKGILMLATAVRKYLQSTEGI